MEAAELLRVDTLLEFRLTSADELAAFAWADPQDLPIALVSRTAAAVVRYLREGRSPSCRRLLDSLEDTRLMADPAGVAALLGAPGAPIRFAVEERHHLPGLPDPSLVRGTSRQGSYFVWMEGARPVAWAWTVREHGRAAQGSVQRREPTTPTEFARRVLAAWVASVRESGKLAFFRHPTADRAAEELARSLGAEHYATTVRYG